MNRNVLDQLKANPKTRPATSEPVTTPRSPVQRKPIRLFWPLIVLFGVGALALLGWSAMHNPVLASMRSVQPTPQAQTFWAHAQIAKPSALPSVVVPTPIPQEITLPDNLNPSVPSALTVQIVPDTPMPEYGTVTTQEEAPAAAYTGTKYILVDISEQHMYVYENDQLVYSFVASTGMNNATRVGTFAIQSKIPNAYGSTWDIWMPYWLGIYWAGGSENGIHALPILPDGSILWEGFLGRPVSYGCVVLSTYEAELLYNWAEYGTPVEIQW